MEEDNLVDSQMEVVYNILKGGNVEEVRRFTDTDEFQNLLTDRNSESISSISSIVNTECAEVLACYEEILKAVVESVDPKDSFITLLEQLDEETCSLERFIVLLEPLRICLQKLAGSRKVWLEWALNTIQQYVEKLTPPEDHQPDDDEKMLVDDPYLGRLLALCRALFSFFETFVNSYESEREKDALIAFGLQVLTDPTMYVYVEKFEEMQLLQAYAVEGINNLSPNLHYLLDLLDEKCLSNLEKDELKMLEEAAEDEPRTMWDRISPVNLAAYYCARINESHFLQYFPQVYDGLYLFHKLLVLCVILLRHSHNAVRRKGLRLSTRLVSSMAPRSISRHYLVYGVHEEFINLISKISRHSSIYENRQEAFQLLVPYIHLFDSEGRYTIFLNISSLTNNEDIDGEIITNFRNDWLLNYSRETLEFYQKGKLLIDLLKSFCVLPNLANTDLMLHKAKILAVLHLFALLVKQDTKNVTGVRDHFEYFEKNYFLVVAEALKKWRSDYHGEMQRLRNDDPSDSAPTEIPVGLEVGGQQLPPLRRGQKIEAIGFSLTALDVIELALKLLYEYANRDVSQLL